MANECSLPRSFRTSRFPFAIDASLERTQVPSREGLDQLQLSGSGQFSALGLEALVTELAPLRDNLPLLIVDLRQESHGFIDGAAVSWYGGKHDWANRDKQPNDVERDQRKRLQHLQRKGEALIYPNKHAEEPAIIHLNEVYSERQLMQRQSILYLRLYVTDHLRPEDAVVERFLQLYGALQQRVWWHFHCAAGRGRTTTFMAMVDIIHNAHALSLEEILERQKRIGGTDLVSVADGDWNKEESQERHHFLQNFYNYVKADLSL